MVHGDKPALASDESAVKNYFDGAAENYSEKTERGLLKIIRKMESDAVRRALGDVVGKDILEIGCGAGHYTRRMLAAGAKHVWAVDLSEAMLAALASPCVSTVHADAQTFQIARSFELVVSIGMLEFVPDPAAVLANAARHAAPGARLVLMVPRPSVVGIVYKLFHRSHGFDIRLFGKQALAELAGNAGWRPARIETCPPLSYVATFVRM